ncbi:MAG: hypothetical protein ACLTCQ_23510 [Enterocloster bolteae]
MTSLGRRNTSQVAFLEACEKVEMPEGYRVAPGAGKASDRGGNEEVCVD